MPQRFRRSQRPKVTDVSAPDARTVVMKISHRSAVFLDSLARTDCGMTAIVHKDSVGADGNWDKPIGTGPYQFKEWKRGEYVLLTAFGLCAASGAGDKPDGYVGAKRALADEVRFLVVPDASSSKAGLVSGAIDASQITNTDVAELKGNPAVAVMTRTTPPSTRCCSRRRIRCSRTSSCARPSPPRWIFRRSWRRRRKGWAS